MGRGAAKPKKDLTGAVHVLSCTLGKHDKGLPDKMKLRVATFAAGFVLACSPLAIASPLAAQDAPVETVGTAPKPVWPFEASDIEVDPGFTFGVLDNGMRYILRQNATPEGTALVRMRIASGSLDETDEERGLSHLLEHMAFNGSKAIPEGEMIKLLEREGLAFGADTNASTDFEAITYLLNLPRNDEALLDTALMLMRETASELTIAEDAVERERGVVLAEKRDRDGFELRAYEDNVEFIAPDARFGDRLPIGTAEVLTRASAGQVRALYERTYTPANTVLVIVGDFPVAVMEAKLRARFADWRGGPAPADPVTGPVNVALQGLTDIHIDPALSESVTITRFSDWRDEPDTLANRERELLRNVGYAIVNRRLGRLASGPDAPFRDANFGSGDLFKDARSTNIWVSSVDGEWQKGVLAAAQIVNQALTFGFTQAEIDEQLANIRTALERNILSADTRSNAALVGQALNLIENERIPSAPAYVLDQFTRVEPGITPDNVLAALRENAAPLENPLIRFQGRAAPAGGADALRSAFAEGKALPISAPADTGPVEFGYKDFGPPGQVIADSREERLGIRRIRFANGVRLNLKQTDVSRDRINVRIELDGGNLLNTREEPLKVYLAESIPAGGLGKHSVDELQSVLAGKSVSYGFGTGSETFTLGGGTTPRDLDLQLRLLTAFLTDPGYRPEGVERFRKGIDNFFETLDATPGNALNARIGAILSDSDPRFSLQSKEAFKALDYAELKAAIGDRLRNGAIEVALVGDLDEDAAIAAVAASLGALPMREFEFQKREEARERPFTADRSPRRLTHKGEADQALIQIVWPTRDDSDLIEDTQLALLAQVAQIMVLEKLREELGQAYSPGADSSTSFTYRGYGTFTMGVSVAVGEVEPSLAAMLAIVEQLRRAPPDPDVIERARKPSLEAYDNALKSLGGWLSLADIAQSRADRIERYFAFPDTLKAITGEDLQAAAIRYLDPQAGVQVIVVPEAASE
jgi:zinc protease